MTDLNKEQIFAIVFAVLMVGSMIAYGVALI